MKTRLYLVMADTTIRTKTKLLLYNLELTHLPSANDIVFLNEFEFSVEKLMFDLDTDLIDIKLNTVYVAEYEDFEEKVSLFKSEGWY